MVQRVGDFFELTHRSRTSGAGRSDKNPLYNSHFTKGTWNSVFFLRTIFFKKPGNFPRNERNCTTCRECLETFNGQATGHLVWIIPWLWGMIWKHGRRFFLPQDAMEKVDVHILTSIDTLKMILARTSKDGSIPSFHPVRRRVWCLAKRRITSFFRLKVLVRFLSGAPTVFWEDGGKGYSDGKASEKNVRLKHETGMNMNEHDMQIENLVIQVYLWWFWLISCIYPK